MPTFKYLTVRKELYGFFLLIYYDTWLENKKATVEKQYLMNMWQEFKNMRLIHSSSICEKQHCHTQNIKKDDGLGTWAAFHQQELGSTTGSSDM